MINLAYTGSYPASEIMLSMSLHQSPETLITQGSNAMPHKTVHIIEQSTSSALWIASHKADEGAFAVDAQFIAVFCVLTACSCVYELGLLFHRPLPLRLDQQPI